jgi:signal transduction histidine kinase
MFIENAAQADMVGDEIVKAQAAMGASEALLDIGRPAEALERCLALRGTEGTRLWPALLPRIESATAKALHALGRHKEAFEAFEGYHKRLMLNNTRVSFQYMKYVELVVQLEKSLAETQTYKKLAGELTLAKSAAEEASRAKTEFLSNMSHELRTPLHAILGFTEIIRGEILGPIQSKYREYIQDVHLSGVHLLNLIDQLLDLSQAESGTVRLSDEIVPVNVLLDDAATRLADIAVGKGTAFRWSLCSGAVVRGDRLRLARCFLNVLSNAIDLADPEGEVGLTTLFEGTELAVAIFASGAGLRPEEVPSAFERFGQGGSPRAVVAAGFGLPLAKRLIELHGGRAVLVSDAGVGTTVTLYFPSDRVVSNLG